MELEELRKEINEIDDELISLFERRMAVSAKIGMEKKKKGLLVYDKKREAEVLKRLTSKVPDGAKEDIEALYLKIFEISKGKQEKINEV